MKADDQECMPCEQWKEIITAVDRLDTLQCLVIDTERVIDQSQKLIGQRQVKQANAEEQNQKLNLLSDKLEKSKAFLEEYMRRMLSQLQTYNCAEDKEEKPQIIFEKTASLGNANYRMIEENNIKVAKDNKALKEENALLHSEVSQYKAKIELLQGDIFLLKNTGADNKGTIDEGIAKMMSNTKNAYQVKLNAVIQKKEIIDKARETQLAEINTLKKEKLIQDQQILRLINKPYEFKATNKISQLEKLHQTLIINFESAQK